MCAYGIEPKRMRLVYPYADKEPNMVLIEGLKGGKTTPLVVYQKDGSYTEELLLYERRGKYTAQKPWQQCRLYGMKHKWRRIIWQEHCICVQHR